MPEFGCPWCGTGRAAWVSPVLAGPWLRVLACTACPGSWRVQLDTGEVQRAAE